MEKYSKEKEEKYFKSYYKYVNDELGKYTNSPGCKLIKENLENISELEISDIRKICELVQFLKISENINIYLYHDWYRHLRN
jgi:hypothetical protein